MRCRTLREYDPGRALQADSGCGKTFIGAIFYSYKNDQIPRQAWDNKRQLRKNRNLAGKPGPDFHVGWPEPAASAVTFGLTGGMVEPGTDHARAGGVKQNSTQPFHSCVPHCLFDLIADPGEHNDMAADPKMAEVIASITARVEAAAATGPPWAWPMDGNPLQTAEYENCQATLKTGFFEPVLASWPPPGAETSFFLCGSI